MSNFGMDFTKLLGQLESVNTKKSYDDEEKDFWKLTKDKDGNGEAIIRFLPNKTIDEFPFVRLYTHAFKNTSNNRWYIERSLSTIDQQDYIAEVNRELWNTGVEANKKIVQARKRKLNYIANIMVVKDTAHPENEGKVFKFKFGQKIFDKIVAAAKPEPVMDEDGNEETPDPINAFSPLEGANFVLKQTIVERFPNYDKSTFLKRKPLFNGDEDKIQEVMDKLHELSEEVAPSKFKSYDELKKKFLWVMGEEGAPTKSSGKAAKSEEDDDIPTPPKKATKVEKPAAEVPKASAGDDEDDDFFRSLVSDE